MEASVSASGRPAGCSMDCMQAAQGLAGGMCDPGDLLRLYMKHARWQDAAALACQHLNLWQSQVRAGCMHISAVRPCTTMRVTDGPPARQGPAAIDLDSAAA